MRAGMDRMGGQELPACALPVQGGGGQGAKDGQGHGVGEEFLGKGDSQCRWEWNALHIHVEKL